MRMLSNWKTLINRLWSIIYYSCIMFMFTWLLYIIVMATIGTVCKECIDKYNKKYFSKPYVTVEIIKDNNKEWE